MSVGRTVTASLRRNDRAFRVGGDEFALVLPGADIDTGLTAARRILASALNGGDPSHPTLPFSLSIGVSAYPAPSAQGSLLYRHADAALYWCKRHGRTNAAAYDPGRHGVAPDDRSIEDVSAAIGTILAQRMLRPVYQPIFSLETGRPIGYESLIRLTEGSPLADANALFAAAERVDRTVELDMACLEVVAEGAGALDAGVYLSVNLSPRTLESELFHPSELTTIFRRRGIEPAQLVVELTEREEVNDLEGLRRNAEACRRAGMRLAADDVGAGNAGLRLLSEVQFDIVKIDLSLVQGGILHDPRAGGPARAPGARLALARLGRRRRRRDVRAARGHPQHRDQGRPGLSPRPPVARSAGQPDRRRGAAPRGVGERRRDAGSLNASAAARTRPRALSSSGSARSAAGAPRCRAGGSARGRPCSSPGGGR